MMLLVEPAAMPRPARRVTAVLALLLAGCLLVAGCGSKTSTTGTGPGSGTTSSGSTGSSPATPGGSSSGSGPTAGAGSSSSSASASTDANGCPTSNTTTFAKSKFVLHTGLAFGTFHRYIYKPLKAGQFSSGASGRAATFAKAAATALFAKREIRLASQDVKANPTLCRVLAAPLNKLAVTFDGLGTRLKHGDTSGVSDANSQIAGISAVSAKGGAPITERTDENAG